MRNMLKDKNTMYILAAIIFSALTIGVLSTKFMGDDNPVEEVTESVIEDAAEELFDLDDHELKGKIDFSYQSKET
jgi:hypothetical protein